MNKNIIASIIAAIAAIAIGASLFLYETEDQKKSKEIAQAIFEWQKIERENYTRISQAKDLMESVAVAKENQKVISDTLGFVPPIPSDIVLLMEGDVLAATDTETIPQVDGGGKG